MVFNCLHFLKLWNSFILTIPEWSLLTWDFWKTRTFSKRSQYFDWTQLDIGLHENKEAHRWVILIPAIQVWSCDLVDPFYPDLGNTLGGGGAELPWPWGLLSDSLCFLLASSYLFVVNNEHSSSAPGMALLFPTSRPGIPVDASLYISITLPWIFIHWSCQQSDFSVVNVEPDKALRMYRIQGRPL